MKKLLACLVCVLIMLSSALAETVAFDISLDVPERALADVYKAFYGSGDGTIDDMFAAKNAENILIGLAKLLDSLHVRGFAAEDDSDFALNVSLGDTTLVEMIVDEQAEQTLMELDLMSGCVLATEKSEQQKEFEAYLKSCDAYAVARSLEEFGAECAGYLPVISQEGSFAGAAYAGGSYRVGVTVDDRDFFVLLEDLLRYSDSAAPLREFILNCAALLDGRSPDEAREDILAAAFEAARKNEYSYTLYTVYDENNPIGMSLMMEKDQHQVASISVGTSETGVKLAVGYGFQGSNVYFLLNTTDGQTWRAEMVLDPDRKGIPAARRVVANSLLTAQCNVDSNMGMATIAGSLLKGHMISIVWNTAEKQGEQSCDIKISFDSKQLMAMNVSLASTGDDIAIDLTDKTVYNVMDENIMAELDADTLDEMTGKLLMRLMKSVPSELLTLLMQLP